MKLRNRVTLTNHFSFVWILFGYPIWKNNLQSLPGNLRKLIDNFWGSVAFNHRVRINVKKLQQLLFDWHPLHPLHLPFFALKCSVGRTRLTTAISFHWVNHLCIHSDLLSHLPYFFEKKSLNIYSCYLYFKEVPPSVLPFNLIFSEGFWSPSSFLLLAASGLLPWFSAQSMHRVHSSSCKEIR